MRTLGDIDDRYEGGYNETMRLPPHTSHLTSHPSSSPERIRIYNRVDHRQAGGKFAK